MAKYTNISLPSGTISNKTLLAKGGYDKPTSLLVASTNLTSSIFIDLFITDGTNSYFIVKNMELPEKTSVLFEEAELSYDTITYDLKFSQSGSGTDISMTH